MNPLALPLRAPRAIVVSTGTEITQGLYADTNAMEISRILLANGFQVVGHIAAPDDVERIETAIRSTFGLCEFVVVTGGLGPTVDDLNREIFSRLWQSELRKIHRAEVMMRERFTQRGREMPESNICQAFIPACADPLLNFWGTAPGMLLPPGEGRPALMALPGVPHEWRAMMDRYLPRRVLPLFPQRPCMVVHTLHLAMIPESTVNQMLGELFDADPRINVAMLASLGAIRVRLTATATSETECREAIASFVPRVKGALPADRIYAEGPENMTFEAAVIERFRARGKKMALAESCTGGGVAKRLTNVPHSSMVLLEGLTTYSNEAKMKRLGVRLETLEKFGAVSAECVREMAEGALAGLDADVAVAISGIAGPGGGTPEKPVGTVWFGLTDRTGGSWIRHHRIPGDRDRIRHWAENQALDMLRRWVDGLPIE